MSGGNLRFRGANDREMLCDFEVYEGPKEQVRETGWAEGGPDSLCAHCWVMGNQLLCSFKRAVIEGGEEQVSQEFPWGYEIKSLGEIVPLLLQFWDS